MARFERGRVTVPHDATKRGSVWLVRPARPEQVPQQPADLPAAHDLADHRSLRVSCDVSSPSAKIGQLMELARALDVLGPVRAGVDLLTAS